MPNLITQLKTWRYWKRAYTIILNICFIPLFILGLMTFLFYEYFIYEKPFFELIKEYWCLFRQAYIFLKEVIESEH